MWSQAQLVILHVVVNYAYLCMDYYVFMDGLLCIYGWMLYFQYKCTQLLPPNHLQLR